MAKRQLRLLYPAVLGIILVVAACSLPASAVGDLAGTQTAIASAVAPLFTPLATSPTPIIASTLTLTATLDPNLITPILTPTVSLTPASLPTIVVGRPSSYALQKGEFPYCIARRFNVHPDDLLASNGLTRASGTIYAVGLVLQIPQAGRPFPVTPGRALRPHPATYTVSETGITVYKVACYYGDVDPAVIMQNNGLTSSILTAGQTLQIP